MKKVLIATTNRDKFDTVSKIFRNTIFPEEEYIIERMNDEMNIPDEKEEGNNNERARKKALNAFNHLKIYNFDYIVGLDDAVIINGKAEPNIKEYLHKILFDNYLKDNEEYAFNRAYAIIDKKGNIYETNTIVPYIYKSLPSDIQIENYTYPLAKVSYPIGYNKPICELTEQEEIEYYLKYVKNDLSKLDI